jgi:thiol-disulfide isomerase/thioredoxin
MNLPTAAGLALALFAAGCAAPGPLPDIPTDDMMPPGVNKAHLHFTVPAVKSGMEAPDFTLEAANGSGAVSLSSYRGHPLVLVFGSCTCGPFRKMLKAVEGMKEKHGGKAAFLMVYVREAHPTDEWRMEDNDKAGWALAQPTTDLERQAAALEFAQRVSLSFPVLADRIDDAVSKVYGGWPGRFLVIDAAGKVLYRSEVGPFGFRPAELERAIEKL